MKVSPFKATGTGDVIAGGARDDDDDAAAADHDADHDKAHHHHRDHHRDHRSGHIDDDTLTPQTIDPPRSSTLSSQSQHALRRSVHDCSLSNPSLRHTGPTSTLDARKCHGEPAASHQRHSIADMVGRSSQAGSTSSLKDGEVAPILRLYPRKSLQLSRPSLIRHPHGKSDPELGGGDGGESHVAARERGSVIAASSDAQSSSARLSAKEKLRRSWSVKGAAGLVSGVVSNNYRKSSEALEKAGQQSTESEPNQKIVASPLSGLSREELKTSCFSSVGSLIVDPDRVLIDAKKISASENIQDSVDITYNANSLSRHSSLLDENDTKANIPMEKRTLSQASSGGSPENRKSDIKGRERPSLPYARHSVMEKRSRLSDNVVPDMRYSQTRSKTIAETSNTSNRSSTADSARYKPVLAAFSQSNYNTGSKSGSKMSLRFSRIGHIASGLHDMAIPNASTDMSVTESTRERQDYYDYLSNQQRHTGSNFILKLDSADMIYTTPQIKVKIVGPYVFGDKIGKGAFGKVKEGLCSETLQRVAIKILNKKRLRKVPRGVETTLREIRELRKLKHRNIITLIDVYCKVEDDEQNLGIFNWFPEIENETIMWNYDDGTEIEKKVEVVKWYMVFEYCPCSLQTLMEQSPHGRLSEAAAHQFFGHLIKGLEYLHSQSIVHRDIKPGNMLITADGVLKISDFGVAEQFSPYDKGEMICQDFSGTHQFLSPEVVDGTSDYSGAKVDMWAAGVTLYNMVTGAYPFEFPGESNILGLYELICGGAFNMPDYLDTDLKHLITCLLQKDPATRYSTTEAQTHPWLMRNTAEFGRTLTRVMSYPLVNSPPENEDAAANKVRITPCETTMIPYLEKMYAEELESHLKQHGAFYQLELAGAVSRRAVRQNQNRSFYTFAQAFKSLFRSIWRRDEENSQ